MEKDTVKINNEEIVFFYKRKKIKNIIMKINSENQIVISLPMRCPLYKVKEFIIRKYSWVEQNKKDKQSIITPEEKEKLSCYLKDKVAFYQNQMKDFDIPIPQIEIRKMKSVWGSCHIKQKKIIFNLELVRQKEEFINYVIVHELAHFKHANHSKEFYKVVEIFIPDYKTIRKAKI